MKKTLIFLLVLIIAVSSLTAFMGYKLYNEGKDVTYTLVSEKGDRSYLDGVSADISYSHYGRLHWDVHYVPFEQPEAKVSFTKTAKYPEKTLSYHGLSTVYFSLLEVRSFSEKLYNVFEKAKKDAVNSEKGIEIDVKMKDYFDTYPIIPEVSLPGINISYMSAPVVGDEGEYSYSGITKERAEGFISALREYISIPVYEYDRRTTVIERSDPGYMYYSDYENSFEPEFQTTVFSDKMYFTVNNRTNPSESLPSVILDTSDIPGGYGIYSVPYSEKDIAYENISTEMSLSPESTVLYLWGDEDKAELYLIIRENESCFYKVINEKTMTEKFSVRLFGYTDGDWVHFRSFDDFILFFRSGSEMILFEKTGDGEYTERLYYVETGDNFIGLEYLIYNSEWVSDGERLVSFSVDSFPDSGDGSTLQQEIGVFTRDGMMYYSKTDCSLGDLITRNFSGFVQVDEYSVHIK